uniref:Uncharacterized protein n=1 Tax=Cucumis melo TaxID=3656 RepID=A0A9I9DUE5_CUCME
MGVESEALREITSENSLGEESSQMLKEIDEGKILVQEKRKKKEEAEGLHEREEKESKKEDAKRERSKKRNLNVRRARWPVTRTWKKRKRSAKKVEASERKQKEWTKKRGKQINNHWKECYSKNKWRKNRTSQMIEVDQGQRQGWPGMIEDDCERRIGEDECEQAVGSESQEDDGQHQWQSRRCSKVSVSWWLMPKAIVKF